MAARVEACVLVRAVQRHDEVAYAQHRKVFEVLGGKTKCPPTDDQISGVGFTSARGDSVIAIVNGRRAYNIGF